MTTVDRILGNQPLTIEELFTLPVSDIRLIAWPEDIELLLNQNGYTRLGWLNSGIQVPFGVWDEVYNTITGTYCICINKETKQYYCVDRGD